MVWVLGSRANADKVELFIRVIEHNNFATLTVDWSCRVEGLCLVLGLQGRSSYYLFSNPYIERTISAEEACRLVCVPRARFPACHPLGLDFEALAAYEGERTGEGSDRGRMNSPFIGNMTSRSTMASVTRLSPKRVLLLFWIQLRLWELECVLGLTRVFWCLLFWRTRVWMFLLVVVLLPVQDRR